MIRSAWLELRSIQPIVRFYPTHTSNRHLRRRAAALARKASRPAVYAFPLLPALLAVIGLASPLAWLTSI